jgi:hypothetical protein
MKKPCNQMITRLFLWSWRDSNPRPNKQYASFLHAYFAIDFRTRAESKHPTQALASKIFESWPKLPKPYFRIPMPQNQMPQNRAFVRHLASLLKSSGNA